MCIMVIKRPLDNKKNDSTCLVWFLIFLSSALFLILVVSIYILFSCSEIQTYFKRRSEPPLDDDEIKLQVYLLESNFYLDEIYRTETELASASKDYKRAIKNTSIKASECVKRISPSDAAVKEHLDLESRAENSIKYFKQILTNWNANIDYMDVNTSLKYLINQYQSIFFDPNDWKSEKVDKRLIKVKRFYDSVINEIEKCTLPYDISQEYIDNIQNARRRIILTDLELDVKKENIYELDEELIRTLNKMLTTNVQCLRYFPMKWSAIQHEQKIVEREIDVLKFKLKQVRFRLMAADSKEKLDSCFKSADNLNNQQYLSKVNIDEHYEKAELLQRELISEITLCSNRSRTVLLKRLVHNSTEIYLENTSLI